jgi:alkylhydroperoxidase family enzyme
MRHPALAGPFLAYNAVLLNAPTIEPRWRELLVLRVAWRTKSTYEWAQHVRLSQRVGITAEQIEAIGTGPDAGVWSELEAALLTAADQLLEHYSIDDPTWAALAEHLDERQLVEVTFVVGTYACLAMAFNSFGLALDPELAASAPPLPGRDPN